MNVTNPLSMSAAVDGTLPLRTTWLKYILNNGVNSNGFLPPSRSRNCLPFVMLVLAELIFLLTAAFSMLVRLTPLPVVSKSDDNTAISLTPCSELTSAPNDAVHSGSDSPLYVV